MQKQLEIIRQYFDTTGIRLSVSEKELLCLVLYTPEKYDGFTSNIYQKAESGRDYRDTWDSLSEWQYRINIDTTLTIDKRWRHSCDGYIQDSQWTWQTAAHITDIREIIRILDEIQNEL